MTPGAHRLPLGPWQLALAYAAFAGLATLANLLAQEGVLALLRGALALYPAMVVGTGVGLVVKYLLDKRYIFAFYARDAAHERETFLRYAVTGLITTVIFWGAEIAFHLAFGTTQARHAGAVLGLAVGYVIKYRLDKRHVFRRPAVPC
ncbi:GtrA family protein [Achromobacter sp. GG226]|uniref:GtrA family protein n=1 Tax=Verticiella alkaliphila TaxID=2779529 RepID=UPI001C0CC8BF|nr:GtrA family protein [Verticiella sp. GG226]MBU4611149.1 GtrA family protein [Verticiella sp. GG226]